MIRPWIAWSGLWFDFIVVVFLSTQTPFITFLKQDNTGISFGILFTYLMLNITILGSVVKNPWQFSCIKITNWCHSVFLIAGLLGTIIGFYILFDNLFEGFRSASTEEIKIVLDQITNGTSVALITTMTGIIATIVTSLKLNMIGIADD